MSTPMRSLLAAHEAYKKHAREGLKKYKLKARQPKIMYYIYTHAGCQQKDIAENCYVETATLSSVLRNLERRNLIERRSLSTDKRAYSIFPKKESREIFEAVKEQFESTTRAALSDFSEKEAKEFIAYLIRVEHNLRKDKHFQERISNNIA